MSRKKQPQTQKLIELLHRLPAVREPVSSSQTRDGRWQVQFYLDLDHPYAWSVVQELAFVLNWVSVSEQLPTRFFPVSPPPYLNGGARQFLAWVIASESPEFSADQAAECLTGYLPQPPNDLSQWQNDAPNACDENSENEFTDCEQPLTEDDIQAAAEQLGAELPHAFRLHYLHYNGGTPRLSLFVNDEIDYDDIEISQFIPIRYAREFADDPEFTLEGRALMHWVAGEVPNTLIPFAMDWGGNYICLEKDSGRIVYYVRDVWRDHLSTEANFAANSTIIAESFGGFLAHLQANPDDFDDLEND